MHVVRNRTHYCRYLWSLKNVFCSYVLLKYMLYFDPCCSCEIPINSGLGSIWLTALLLLFNADVKIILVVKYFLLLPYSMTARKLRACQLPYKTLSKPVFPIGIQTKMSIEFSRWWTDAMKTQPRQGLPYIPRVHLSECSLVWSPLKWLWSEETMVRRSFIPKFLYSERCYVPKIPYSERPSTIWILCYEDSLV